ncbi:adenylate/guanylate cyclase [Luminiphilus syltensis NOR5-1B]|uniref:Adenylate/guanylate cyclase n=1 Tax=Luminiphilus syltensis NOR5-1B TaxID=565045 RepID=B8KXE5_9GAMM|nr:adenylate/guanylate cyclase domain-containing protein [Luminiphilus syltensis]EED36145.1 adenylate/guanylate cyclase [Luminiphilus syltensis NOR5-1B]
MEQVSETPVVWAQKVLDAVGPLRQAAARRSIAVSDHTRQDIDSLLDAGDRLNELMSGDSSSKNHDLLNVIGAIRGYAEMLNEESADLHPGITTTLPAILSVVRSTVVAGASNTAKPPSADPTDAGVILAVDDMPENRELISRLLHRSGHTVITAESGEEALELLGTMAVDVVLLDLMMPGIGGAEVLRRLKDDPELRATPVVMISGRQDMQQIIGCIQAGADDYLLKPFNPVVLQARISAGIERKRWHDREQQYRRQLERNEAFIRATFGRYLSDQIVDEILESPEGLELGGDLREVTIMMSDIRGFTTLSEHLPPQKVVQLLNRYLGRMTEIIIEHDGTIDEFLGDAVLAVFGAPRHADDDAERAVKCAIAMQAAMEEVNQQNSADGLPELDMALALNTGTVVAGNIGSERRAKYGFVGHAMNVTSRIEDATGRKEILISESTLEKLPDHYELGDRRSLSVKGIEESVVVYQLLGASL